MAWGRLESFRRRFAKEPTVTAPELPPHEVVGVEFSIYSLDQTMEDEVYDLGLDNSYRSRKLVRIPGIQGLLPLNFSSSRRFSLHTDERDDDHVRRLVTQPTYIAPFAPGHGTQALDPDLLRGYLEKIIH